ncbi:hypothetical protein [Paradevosia shaoguanensis]|uniref:Uncharacterized protein n=1 Tax=Paradevosia shaoguanensis TaxID=1335043 RepID=A0AA41QKZ8_9HYPH|nr:hypothetical protein [Paradevosia shaoguanensis]MCF1742061.1 hypothetical protein [Paradevosia shaoguanensis]MCI0126544.1 hypothetical protein [Paradevosia shaoguanensis]
MASVETVAAYRTEALKKIRRAKARFPELYALDALFRYVSDYSGTLAPNSVRLWRQQMRIAVTEASRDDPREFSGDAIHGFIHAMDEAVDALKGRPNPPRTSTKKRKDPPKSEVVAVFAHLKKRALELHRPRMAATAIFCVLMSRIGGRPVELVGASVRGSTLILPNAKRAVSQATERPIMVDQWDLHHRVALAALIDLVNSEVGDAGYQAWLSTLAEILARACQAVGVPRLAPSSFRHTALSTWSAAGFSTEEIALLAGHFCRRSPSHYIRTASAWGPEDATVAPLGPAPTPEVEEVRTDTSLGLDFEPMPQPNSPPPRADISQRLWNEHRQRMDEQEKSLDLVTKRTRLDRMRLPREQQTRQQRTKPGRMP